MLELIKESLLDIVQHELLGPIHVKARVDGPGHIESSLLDVDYQSEFDASEGDGLERDAVENNDAKKNKAEF